MQYSPKLKKVMAEIEDVLKKHDIAAFILLHTPGFSEYLQKVSPSYSCAVADDSGVSLKVNAKEVGEEKAKKLIEGTVNMVVHFAEILGKSGLFYHKMLDQLKQRFEIEETGDGHTSHSSQNN